MQEWIKRQEGYRKWREEGHGEKILYKPSAFSEHKKSTQETYDELSKPTESERLQDELEPIIHPAMAPKRTTPRTLEEETEEWNFCMDEAAVSYTHLTLPTKARCRSRWSPYH